MLVNTLSLLRQARAKGYAIGAFNTSDLEISQGIIEAAVELRSPVILQTSEKAIEYAGLKTLVAMLTSLAEEAPIPVAIHLDHGRSVEIALQAIEAGFTSVMIDTSKDSYAKNVEQVQAVVKVAHKQQIAVEAELGSITGKEDYIEALKSRLTDPDQAAEFVELTGCDSLAVSIGNAHGKPNATEIFDLDRLRLIASKVKIPLVLHGASSTHPARISAAIQAGIAKINIDTDVRLAFSGELREFLARHPEAYDPREYLGSAREAVRKLVLHRIDQFGSANQGGHHA